MSGTWILQLGAIGVAGTLCALTIRRQTPELALVLALVTGGLILYASREALAQAVTLLQRLASAAGISEELLTPLVKTVGISILIRLSSQLCRDGGLDSVATFLELAGSLAALAVAAPLLQSVLELLEELL
ncbi:MAG: SpoIIIAC/SpoIIIAD family protein [Candidatus Onthomonas sp.]